MGQEFERIAALDSAAHMNTYARKPVLFVRGERTRLFDDRGREYVDFMSGIGTVNLGHSHPAVIEAVKKQIEKLTHVTNLFYVEHRADLAFQISELFGGGAKVFFCNSGAEAIEGAVKLARKWASIHKGPQARTIVTAHRSFHGRTLASLAATGQADKRDSFTPVSPGFVHVDLNDIHALEEVVDESVCAVLLEPVQGEGGVFPCDPEYLVEVRALCDKREVLLIFDEVQCGIYRTGPVFAHQSAGIRPHIMTLAKALGNGLPIGAVVADDSVAKAFGPGDHGSTFGGGPVVCAAARATLDALHEEDLGRNASTLGAVLHEGLSEIMARTGEIVEVRHSGLMVAADLKRPVAAEVVARALSDGLVLNNTSPVTLRFLPSLCCDLAEIDMMLDYLEQVLVGGRS